jgi:PKD domain
MRVKRLGMLVAAAVLCSGACTVHQSDPLTLSGPSELALSLDMSATPDHVSQDGSSTSTIAVTAKEINGRVVSNVELRFDIVVNNQLVEFGNLSSKTAFTNSAGRATVVYTAPASSPYLTGGPSTVVSIIAEPVGTNYSISSKLERKVELVVAPPPAPPPVPGAPTAAVSYSPGAPKVGQLIIFNDAGSTAQAGHQIVDWYWDFGDRQPNNEHGIDASHSYTAAGTYLMVYGVTDDLGRMGTVLKQITVAP